MKKEHPDNTNNNASSSRSGGSTLSGNGQKHKKKLPKCLKKKCDQRHLVKDCEITPQEEKDRLLAEYRAEQEQKKKNSSSSRVAALL